MMVSALDFYFNACFEKNGTRFAVKLSIVASTSTSSSTTTHFGTDPTVARPGTGTVLSHLPLYSRPPALQSTVPYVLVGTGRHSVPGTVDSLYYY